MKNTRPNKLIALALAMTSLLAGCGRDIPNAEGTIATVGTTEQTQVSSTSRTTSARSTALTARMML